MQIIKNHIPKVLTIEPKIFGDTRGFFFESFNESRFHDETGCQVSFVQDNHSRSNRGVLRGLHYQIQQAQGKLVRCSRGAVFDVAVDIQKSSSTFGQWVGVILTEDNHKQLWIPPGFAHGFIVLSESADFLYKTTNYYSPVYERCIAWNDPDIGIEWPDTGLPPQLSSKDQQGCLLVSAEVFD